MLDDDDGSTPKSSQSSSLSLLNIDSAKTVELLNVLLSGEKGMTSVVGCLRGRHSSVAYSFHVINRRF